MARQAQYYIPAIITADLLRKRKTILIFTFLQFILFCTQWKYVNSFTLNRNNPEKVYLVPIPTSEVENFRQSRQQQIGGESSSSGAPSTAAQQQQQIPPVNLASNVAQILSGLVTEDVRPIITGSTNFIPGDYLRESVEVVLQNLFVPGLQNLLFGPNRLMEAQEVVVRMPQPESEPQQQQPQNTTTTIIIRIIDETSGANSNIIDEDSVPPNFNEDSATTEESKVTTKVPPTTSTTISPSTARQTFVVSPTRKNSLVFYFRNPNENLPSSGLPSSLYFPESAIQNPHIPQSSSTYMTKNPVDNAIIVENKEEELSKAIEEQQQHQFIINNELTKIIEQQDSSAPSMPTTTEKQYVYLVLLPDEYENFVKYTNKDSSRAQSPPAPVQPPLYANPPTASPPVVVNVVLNAAPTESHPLTPAPPPLPAIPNNVVIAANPTTVQSVTEDPKPTGPGNEDGDDDDDDDNIINRVISSITRS